MSRYVSDRPCPIHGSPVERYIRDNRCCECHANAQRKSAANRINRSRVECARCGSTLVNGICVPCQDPAYRQAIAVPCPHCGGLQKDARNRCVECNKTLFDRRVPTHHRATMRAFLQALNLQHGVTRGDMSWGGIRFDSRHHALIIPFVMELRK